MKTPQDSTTQAAAGTRAKPGRAAGRPRRSAVGWLALLLALGALGASGWMYHAGRQAERDAQETRRQVAQVRQQLAGTRQQVNRGEAARQQWQARQQGQLDALQQAVQGQRRQLSALQGTDRIAWALAEAEFLVRLAHQRLLMAQQPRAALAPLAGADRILRDIAWDGAWDGAEDARAALATDMAALRAAPEFDLEGIWLRLRALAVQVDDLPLLSLVPPGEASAGEAPASRAAERAAMDWRGRGQRSVAISRQGGHERPSSEAQRQREAPSATPSGPGDLAASDVAGSTPAADPAPTLLGKLLRKFSGYLVVRHRETPYQPTLLPQWEGLVRQNLRLLLEQAQVALLSRNQPLYDQSIAAARAWVGDYFAVSQSAAAALDAELAALGALTVARPQLDVEASLAALREAINARHQTRHQTRDPARGPARHQTQDPADNQAPSQAPGAGN